MSPAGSSGLAACLLVAAAASAAPDGDVRPLKLTRWDAAAVARAVDGAATRLADPRCQSVLDEFQDAEGRPLRAVLDEWDVPPSEYLRLIPFLDGSRHPLCRRGNVALVTEVGVRRVYVCTRVFSAHQVRLPRATQNLVIHEALHTLGLGENPPTSLEITARIEARCP